MLNTGSRFWFTAVFRKQLQNKDERTVCHENIRGKHILIVDDNETNRCVLREQLTTWGCRHKQVSSGIEALEVLRCAVVDNDTFEIAIIDMQMPGMDGETLGQKIKKDPELKNTELVMMTSVGKRGDTRRFKDIGFAAYLTKPVKQSQFHDCLVLVTGMQKDTTDDQSGVIVTRHSIAEYQKSRVRFLLAEDDETNQKVALGILKNFGYKTDVVSNGKEALEAMERIPYDMVLMDCQMPQMDGYEATKEIRSSRSNVLNHKVPIIAMTANAMKGDREKCLEAGMDDYIPKPINSDKFLKLIEKWLVKTKGGGHAEDILCRLEPVNTVFDRAGLIDRLLGDEDLAHEILDGFMADIPHKFNTLKEALVNEDARLIQEQAHSLKGASASVGAMAFEKIAYQIELAGKAKDMIKVGSLILELESQFETLKKSLPQTNYQ